MIHVNLASRKHIELIASWQVSMALESESMTLDLPTVIKGVTRVFDEPNIGYYLIATQGQTPVGCCLILKEWSDWRNGFVLWIHSVFTHSNYRRRGVFSSIYKHLQTEVSSASNLRGIRLYVDRGNNSAMETYKTLGMSSDHYHLFEWMK